MDLILSGKVYLVNLVIRGDGIIEKLGYEGVQAHFCYLDFSKYKNDPSSSKLFDVIYNIQLLISCPIYLRTPFVSIIFVASMFEPLARSRRCTQTLFSYDLKKIVALANAMDDSDVHAMEPSGFIFHESRCGSTLVANALTAMDPEEHRVYSEARPPILAMKICGTSGERCPPHRAAELFQDVIYMMGRTRDPKETKLFFKMQSLGKTFLGISHFVNVSITTDILTNRIIRASVP